MIDYLTFRVPCELPRPIQGGAVAVLNAAGQVERITHKRLPIPGSFESSLQVRAPGVHELEVTGNPAKWLQGHNLYGTDDVHELIWRTVVRVLACLPGEPAGPGPLTPEQVGLTQQNIAAAVITRVDVNYMYQLGSRAEVLAWMRSAAAVSRLGRRGRPTLMKGGSLVYGDARGREFARWQVVIYPKGEEVEARSKGHALPDVMAADDEVRAWVDSCLRLEVRFGRLELEKLAKRQLAGWRPETPVLDGWNRSDAAKMWEAKVAQLEFNSADPNADLEKLPRALRAAYLAWKSGADPRTLCSRPTFYRHRSALLELCGVDISVPKPAEPIAEIIPLRRVLEARPVGRPPWADRIEALLVNQGCMALPGAA